MSAKAEAERDPSSWQNELYDLLRRHRVTSGVGNCINMLSLVKGGRFPMLMLVSMRGDFGEGNPWQFPMGRAVEPVLEAMGVICMRVDRPDEVAAVVGAALTMVFQSGNAVAVLLTQRLIGAKPF